MVTSQPFEHVDTIVIGAGQAGLSAGYHLSRRGIPFVILDGERRIGDPWRRRWDSLRLFTPARYDGLDGMPFPAPPHSFPTKDAFADFLERYAERFDLPVRTSARVTRLTRVGGHFVVEGAGFRIEANHVIVAIANYQQPRVPAFAGDLDGRIAQLHSSDYRNPAQLPAGDVLIAGAGNSGSEIATELARDRRVWVAGRDTGHLPFRLAGRPARVVLLPLVLRGLFHRVLTRSTPLGRRVRARILHRGGPLIRVTPDALRRAGVQRTPRVAGVAHGRPQLDDGRVLDVAAVVWCTGFHPGFSWIELPVFGPDGDPQQDAGIVPTEPGLYFLGLHFQYALSSGMIHGVGRDAARIAGHIAARAAAEPPPRVSARVAAVV